MILIGLQNAEKKYEKTRHNVGAIVLKYLVEQECGDFQLDKYTNSFKYKNLYLPNTFMNLSGESVQKIFKQEITPPNLPLARGGTMPDFSKEVFVLFDDVTIPVGSFKLSVGEGASSHNGIKSIIEHTKNNTFTRVRIGVGPLKNPNQDLADFVLSDFSDEEIIKIKSISKDIFTSL